MYKYRVYQILFFYATLLFFSCESSFLEIAITFDEKQQIKTGDPVVWSNQNIGLVKSVSDLTRNPNGKFKIYVNIRRTFRKYIRDDSLFYLYDRKDKPGNYMLVLKEKGDGLPLWKKDRRHRTLVGNLPSFRDSIRKVIPPIVSEAAISTLLERGFHWILVCFFTICLTFYRKLPNWAKQSLWKYFIPIIFSSFLSYFLYIPLADFIIHYFPSFPNEGYYYYIPLLTLSFFCISYLFCRITFLKKSQC